MLSDKTTIICFMVKISRTILNNIQYKENVIKAGLKLCLMINKNFKGQRKTSHKHCQRFNISLCRKPNGGPECLVAVGQNSAFTVILKTSSVRFFQMSYVIFWRRKFIKKKNRWKLPLLGNHVFSIQGKTPAISCCQRQEGGLGGQQIQLGTVIRRCRKSYYYLLHKSAKAEATGYFHTFKKGYLEELLFHVQPL